jgi:methanogenic corrinoid protein MtbC1
MREVHLRRTLAGFRAPVVTETDRWRGALALALCAGNIEHAQSIVTDACDQLPAVQVLDDVLAPTMHHIGTLWEHNQITIADEHLATSVCRQLLTALAPELEIAPPRSRERVVLASATSEQHTTGLLMAKHVLFGAGYDTVLLTDGLSHEALCMELRRYEPAVVALSMTMPAIGDFVATLELVRETLPDARVITGGAAGRDFPTAVGAVYIGRLDRLLGELDEMPVAGSR